MSQGAQSVVLHMRREKGRIMNYPADSEEAANPQEGLLPILSQSCAPLEQTLAALSIWVARQQQSVAVVAHLNTIMDRSPNYADIAEAAIDRLIVEQLLQTAPSSSTQTLGLRKHSDD